jgi:hypothetical protein
VVKKKVLTPDVFEPDESLPRDLVALRRFGKLMDNAIPIPGTGRSFGLDAALGLIPGFGDAAGAIFSLWILTGAVRHRVPFRIVLRMLFNILLDLLVGLIPVIGDIFDFLFTENAANVELVIRHRDRSREPRGVKHIGVALAVTVALTLAVVVIISIVIVYVGIVALQTRH